MVYLVSCVAFSLLFLAHIIPSESVVVPLLTTKDNATNDYYLFYDLRQPILLVCNDTDNTKNPTWEWYKDDTPVSEVESLKNRYKEMESEVRLTIDKGIDDDAGNYTCRLTSVSPPQSATIQVVAKPSSKLPVNTGVVEGETLKITCQAYGNPKPSILWIVGNETYNETRERVQLLSDENGVKNAILTIENVQKEDRGNYTCRAINIANQFTDKTLDAGVTFVRVKDKLAALWPFLGILVEVIVLCCIIFIYEKRRNKPDLDESDTDQSPDQKK